MASTLTVQNLIDFARTHVKLLPLINLGGFQNVPALALANDVKRAIINETYNWEWNRSPHPSFLLSENVDEYPLLVGDMGWIERAYLEWEEDTQTPKFKKPLQVRQNLTKEHFKQDPDYICTDISSIGNKVIRLKHVPTSYPWRCYMDYQKYVQEIDLLTSGQDGRGTFWPIPDTMAHITRQYFLAFAYRVAGDKAMYYSSLAEAHDRINRHRGYSSMEPEIVAFVPDRPLLLE